MTVVETEYAAGRARRAGAWTEIALASLLATLWVVLSAPGPDYFVRSNETGHQLAGAWNLLHSGQWPQIDYFTSYGPGRYLVSALGLLISQNGLFGELLTRTLCCVFYLLLLHRLLRALGADTALTWLLFAAAAIALPPSHKYWTALCPLLTLWAIFRFTRAPSLSSAAVMGLALGFAGLFRADYGLFALVPALVALAAADLSGRRGRITLAMLAGAAVILAPWSIAVAARHNLFSVLVDWAETGAATGAGLALPHPLLNWYDPPLTLAFFFFVLTPLVGLWQQRSQPRGAQRAFALAVHVSALVNLVQSSHRADWLHLLQGLSPGFVSLALVALALPRIQHRWRNLALLDLLLCLNLGSVVLIATPAATLEHWRAVALSKSEFEQNYVSRQPIGQVARLARRCLPPQTPTLFYPFSPQLHYFSERPFAGGMPYLAPGFFSAPAQQAEVIEVLQHQHPPLLFWNEDYAYDDRPERNGVNTHPLLHAYVRTHYVREKRVGDFSVYVLQGSDEALWACVREAR